MTGGSSPYTQSYSDSLYEVVTGHTLTSGGGAQSTIDANGDATATYEISPYWNDGDVVLLVCTFELHFSAAGTAENVQPISCQEQNPNDGEIATFTGVAALSRS